MLKKCIKNIRSYYEQMIHFKIQIIHFFFIYDLHYISFTFISNNTLTLFAKLLNKNIYKIKFFEQNKRII